MTTKEPNGTNKAMREWYFQEIISRDEQIKSMQPDVKRLNFLADPSQFIANVQLPTDIVERNLDSLRNAIDEAMKQWGESHKTEGDE